VFFSRYTVETKPFSQFH